MRILFANNLRGYYGGVEQIIEDYARALTKRGHECLLTYDRDGRDADVYGRTFENTYACSEFGCGKQGQTYVSILDEAAPDVLFVHKLDQLPPDFEQHTGFRRVRMVHDHDLWCPKGTGYYTHNRRTCKVKAGLPCYLDGAFLQRSQGTLLPVKFQSVSAKMREMHRSQHFDSILVVCEYLKKQLVINGFSADKISINNPVIDRGILEPQPASSLQKVIFVGSLIRGKGVDLLLRALARLKCEFEVDIIGTGQSEAKLKALAKELELNDRVNFVGWLAHQDLPRYYREARVVAIPSCWPEPFTLIGQEAMHSARPVVAFDVGGNSDWCDNGSTGFIVPEQDIAAYAEALERLLTDYELAKRMGINGLHKVQTRFSFETSLDKLEAHLGGN